MEAEALDRVSDSIVGKKIRERRAMLGLTLKEIALKSSVSIGLLSQIERGLSSPSVRTLKAIGNALGLTPALFFESEKSAAKESRIIVRSTQRKHLEFENGVAKDLLTPQTPKGIEMLFVTIAPNGTSGDEFYTHPGEESGYVLKGIMTLYVEDDVFRLEAGDAFRFKSTTRHRFENGGKDTAEVIWFLTAPFYV